MQIFNLKINDGNNLSGSQTEKNQECANWEYKKGVKRGRWFTVLRDSTQKNTLMISKAIQRDMDWIVSTFVLRILLNSQSKGGLVGHFIILNNLISSQSWSWLGVWSLQTHKDWPTNISKGKYWEQINCWWLLNYEMGASLKGFSCLMTCCMLQRLLSGPQGPGCAHHWGICCSIWSFPPP